MIIAEAGANCHSFLCDYVATQFDPAHLLSELGFTIAFELLQFIFIFWLWKRVIKPRLMKSVHDQFDAEHHIEHFEDDHIHINDAHVVSTEGHVEPEESPPHGS